MAETKHIVPWCMHAKWGVARGAGPTRSMKAHGAQCELRVVQLLPLECAMTCSVQLCSVAVQAAQHREARLPGSQRALLRSLAALAVLRQASLLLVHYGVRCAYLYLRHSLELLPAVRVLASDFLDISIRHECR